jgi:hypothetical protein
LQIGPTASGVTVTIPADSRPTVVSLSDSGTTVTIPASAPPVQVGSTVYGTSVTFSDGVVQLNNNGDVLVIDFPQGGSVTIPAKKRLVRVQGALLSHAVKKHIGQPKDAD